MKDELDDYEIEYKNELIERGIKECNRQLKEKISKKKYHFFESSIDGFKECKQFTKLSDFEKRIKELNAQGNREYMCSSTQDEILREIFFGIFDNKEKTELGNLLEIEGTKAQINFVYKKLKVYRNRSDEITEEIADYMIVKDN